MRTIPVTILGPHNSGKTVYLASLFRRLALQREDVGFFVQLSPEQSKQLNNVYNEITRPGAWPDPTQAAVTPKWDFTCATRTRDGEVFRPFTIQYMDFSGEHLTKDIEHAEVGAKIWKRIKNSDFLLILLDGVKILRCFDGDWTVVDELIPVLSRIEASEAVVHFVITKWDVLQPAGHTVRSVLDQLLQHPEFRVCFDNRLEKQETSGTLRVIPVSSVGIGFAEFDGENMVKQGNFPSPLNVEIPLMAVLVDLFDRQLKELPDISGIREIEQQQKQRLTWINMLRNGLPRLRNQLSGRTATSPALRMLQESMLDTFMDFVQRKVDGYGQRVEQDVAALRNQVRQAGSEKEALTRLVHLFEATLAEFEIAHPGSHLGKGVA